MEPRIVREFARGLEEILVVEEKRPVPRDGAKDVLYGWPDRPRSSASRTRRSARSCPPSASSTPTSIARAHRQAAGAGKARIESVEARIQHLDELKRRPRAAHAGAHRLLLLGLPAQPVDRGAGGRGGGGGHRLPRHGHGHGPRHHRRHPHGRRGRAVGRHRAVHRDAAPVPEHRRRHALPLRQLAIDYAVAAGVNITYKILYNAAVAMTGGQDGGRAPRPSPPSPASSRPRASRRSSSPPTTPSKYKGVRARREAEVWHRDRLIEAQSRPGRDARASPCSSTTSSARPRSGACASAASWPTRDSACSSTSGSARAAATAARSRTACRVQPVETEFGRKTQIHQSSCNKDYSCLLGDCPSFLTVEPIGRAAEEGRGGCTPLDAELPEPALKVPRRRLRRPHDGHRRHRRGDGEPDPRHRRHARRPARARARPDRAEPEGRPRRLRPQDLVARRSISPTRCRRAARISTWASTCSWPPTRATSTRPSPARTVAVVSTSQIPTGQHGRGHRRAVPRAGRHS